MKQSMIALAAATAVAVVPAGSAAARPVKDKTLTENALYKAGALPTTACREKPIKKLDPKSARSYLNGVLACLNRTWAGELKAAGLKWSTPKVVYATKAPARFCGAKWKDWGSYYCKASRTIEIVLAKDLLEETDDLFLFFLMASLHGEHVQNLGGIARAVNKLPYGSKAEFDEQNRRYYLQNICLASAFVASVWKSLHRGREDWDDLLFYMRDWAGKSTGSRKSVTYWAGQGFATGDPAACNTWTAPSAKVA
ncbi:neutral zinc metallopeptidase [Microbispora catharanthi]|uniref:neutral zinc metallopeptidase n=1 Tax=Microbispora catharanthi TaxID=1712871 RepID=UPI001376E200|nr:neutral zinc metallopeptidase [Microbispora catharanthi]